MTVGASKKMHSSGGILILTM